MLRIVLFASIVVACFAVDSTDRYPTFPSASISISRYETQVYVTAVASTNVIAQVWSAESLDGPWSTVSDGFFQFDTTSRFFRTQVRTDYVRFASAFVAPSYIAVRLPSATNTTEFTTTSGFHLRLQQQNWSDGISIYQVTDGPATDDVGADFRKLFDDLWSDERTDFVAPVSVSREMNGELCFGGYSDQLILHRRDPDYSSDELAAQDLQLLYKSGPFMIVRWLTPKKMRMVDFVELLQTFGMQAEVNAFGCGS